MCCPAVRAGEPLDYQPPQWRARGRTDSITLPGGLAFLFVEGVGASQASLRDGYDLVFWVETEEPTRSARDLVRLAAGEMSAGGFERWMAEENAYTTRERPWEHADLLVYGGESIPYDRDGSRTRRPVRRAVPPRLAATYVNVGCRPLRGLQPA